MVKNRTVTRYGIPYWKKKPCSIGKWGKIFSASSGCLVIRAAREVMKMLAIATAHPMGIMAMASIFDQR